MSLRAVRLHRAFFLLEKTDSWRMAKFVVY